MGAMKKRMNVKIAGGATMDAGPDGFNIGKRNHTALRKMFFKNNVMIDYEDVGGNVNRTVRLEIGTGEIYNKISGHGEVKI